MTVPAWLNTPHTLREYALLGDGERGAIVGPRGDLVWMCFPHWDSEPLFSALIGGGGTYAVTPIERHVWGGYYEPRSLIWRSRWATRDAIVECRQALALPADPGRVTILCRAATHRGSARLLALLDPRAALGRHGMRDLALDEHGVWRARLDGLQLTWSGAADARVVNAGRHRALALDLELSAGEHHDLVLTIAVAQREHARPDADAAWRETEQAWQARVGRFEQTIAPRDAAHAGAVISGMTSSGGGMVAAATTSLPERADEGRNYDYRYVWIRDQCYAGEAAARSGALAIMDDSVRFVTARLAEHGRELRPAYTGRGTAIPEATDLGLEGYPGGAAVIGNRVSEQFQLDIFGEILLLFAAAAGNDHLDADGWRAAELAAGTVLARWREPDAGIWELDPPVRWTHSRLICAAGLRAIAVARAGPPTRPLACRGGHDRRDDQPPGAAPIGSLAARPAMTRASTRRCCWPGCAAPSRATTHGRSRPARQSSVTSPRICTATATVPTSANSATAEGAFVLCGFWMALALEQQGRASAGGALVRAQPRRLRTAGPFVRRVRRQPAPAARQPAAGIRARAAARVRCHLARRAVSGSSAVDNWTTRVARP